LNSSAPLKSFLAHTGALQVRLVLLLLLLCQITTV